MVFIKTANTPGGNVEVHIASGKSHYQQLILQTPTPFGIETDGVWTMADYTQDGTPDLVFIKTANTTSGTVEALIASASSKYQHLILETPTTFGIESDGTWQFAKLATDLAPIKNANTASAQVEVRIAAHDTFFGASGTI